MQRFDSFTSNDVPNESKSMLESIESTYGFTPNLTRGLAQSPESLKSYTALSEAFSASDLGEKEQQIVLLTASRFNECSYCTSAHSVTAEQAGLPWETIEKIRNREAIDDERLETLRTFTEHVVSKKGSVPQDALTSFLEAGFSHRNALDVVLGVTLKTLTNTVNHMIDTPLDTQFEKRAWSVDQTKMQTVSA